MSATNQGVYNYARQNSGSVVGNGQCWTLVEEALKDADGQTSNKLMKGKVTANGDYVWGTLLGTQVQAQAKTLKLQPGDIIQFRNYTCSQDGGDPDTRPHHSAIIASVNSDGSVEVYESNVPDGDLTVQKRTLYIRSGTVDDTSIKVTGKMWFYRPKPN